MRRTVGKDENSSELAVKSATKRINTPMEMLIASSRSRMICGNGTTMMSNIPMTPVARMTSVFRMTPLRGRVWVLAAKAGP